MTSKWDEFHQRILAEAPAAIRVEPLNPRHYIELASAYDCILGKPGEARRLLRRAIRLDPCNSTAYNNLGLNLLNAGKFRQAEAALREALRLESGNWVAHLNLGTLFFKRNHVEEGIKHYRTAIRLAPAFIAVNHRRSLATMLGWSGRYRQALTEYKRLLRLDPDNMMIYGCIAGLYEKLGNTRYAIHYYEQYSRYVDEPEHVREKIAQLRRA